jgi:ribosomal protein L11 methyltransferase
MFKLSKLTFEFDKQNSEMISDFLSGIGAIGVAEDFIDDSVSEISAYFPNFTDINEIIYKIKNYVNFLESECGEMHTGSFQVEEIDESKWRVWKDILKAVKVTDNIVIRPPWEKYESEDGQIVIEINPSMAFGTGHHESTRLCIEAAEQIISTDKIDSVLDVGCGSGILSIVACKLGVKNILAFDIDPVSIDESVKNIGKNGITKNITTRCCAIEEIEGTYDLILANVYAEPLLSMREAIKSRLNKNGKVILSGFQDFREKELISGYEEIGFKLMKKYVDGEWVCTVFNL